MNVASQVAFTKTQDLPNRQPYRGGSRTSRYARSAAARPIERTAEPPLISSPGGREGILHSVMIPRRVHERVAGVRA